MTVLFPLDVMFDFPLLQNLIQNFSKAKILCIGDLILDTFNHGSVNRFSPERPVPIFSPGDIVNIPGGAANVARNISSLGASCSLVGMIGKDDPSRILKTLLDCDLNIDAHLLGASRPISHKVRFIATSQHLMRLDSEVCDFISDTEMNELLAIIEPLIPIHDVIVLSDYEKGLLSPALIKNIIKLANNYEKKVVVDPKNKDFSCYSGASLLTPNSIEIERAVGFSISTDADAEFAGHLLLKDVDVSAILITRGSKGMSLISVNDDPLHLTSRALDVFDVVGAGDTVIATLACSMALGGGMALASAAANLAAGLVVAKPDTATVTPEELLDRFISPSTTRYCKSQKLFLQREELFSFVAARRLEGKCIGFTNGVFDLVHPGHVSLLRYARECCDILIVGLNSDSSVRLLGKGSDRPINCELDRAIILGALEMVDATSIFEEETPLALIELIRPDVLIKGSDYTIETIVGSQFVLGYGGKVLLAPLEPGHSSTQIIKKIFS